LCRRVSPEEDLALCIALVERDERRSEDWEEEMEEEMEAEMQEESVFVEAEELVEAEEAVEEERLEGNEEGGEGLRFVGGDGGRG